MITKKKIAGRRIRFLSDREKALRKEYQRRYRAENADKLKAYSKNYQLTNKETLSKKHKARCLLKKEEYTKTKKQWQKNNKDKLALSYKRRREKQHPDYYIWVGMKQRCYNQNNKDFSRYGNRGVKVCPRWKESFDAFIEDMGNRPNKQYSLERKNVNGDYEPDNCIWATAKEQANNRRDNISNRISIVDESPIYYPYNNLTTLTDFSKITGIPLIVVKYRYAKNWDADWILDNSENVDNRFWNWKGRSYNVRELSLISGIKRDTLYWRLYFAHWSVDRAME